MTSTPNVMEAGRPLRQSADGGKAPASTAGRTVDGRQAHAERAGVPIAEQRNGDGGQC